MMETCGFMSRSEVFPAGLRVLVVDDDLAWLKILEKMLKKCNYEVTTCGLAREALRLLRERKDGFDIVISDVNMPDMDGFKLLEHVGLEMDLPVIMMSVDGETSRVMKGVQHGACDYLLKPIRMKELRNIWQHVFRKRMHEVRDIECMDDRSITDHFDDAHFGGEQVLVKKRKDHVIKQDEKDLTDPSCTKKARVVWSVDLHQKFVKAVNQIGLDSEKVGPKKILDLMNVPWLTRENVASHLQKYRLYLSRLQKENELKSSFGGVKNPDHSSKTMDNSPKDLSGSFSIQSSTVTQQSDAGTNYICQGNHLPIQTADSKSHEGDLTSVDLLSLREHHKPFNGDTANAHITSSSSTGLDRSFGSLENQTIYGGFDSPKASQYTWCPGDLCVNPGPSVCESNRLGLIDIKPLSDKLGEEPIESLSVTCKTDASLQAFDPSFDTAFDMTKLNSDPGIVISLESEQKNQILGTDYVSSLSSDDLMFYRLTELGFDNIGFSEYYVPELTSEVPKYFYSMPRFGFEYEPLCDQVEYPVMDEGLFIA